MRALLSFKGEMRRLPYALASAAAFFSQHVFVLIALRLHHAPVRFDFMFYVVPWRSFGRLAEPSNLLLLAALAYALAVAWALAAMAFRRAANADANEWISAGAIVSVVQVAVFLVLCVVPSRAPGDRRRPADVSDAGAPGGAAAVQGVVVGGAATLLAVALGTLVFGIYGYGLFIVSPFVVGAVAAYLANRHADVGAAATGRVVFAATVVGALGLVVTALEGLVCIILAAPLGFGATIIGGQLGRSIALRGRRPAGNAVFSFALLPLAFTLESTLPNQTDIETRQGIAINAPPDVVWRSIVTMDTMDEPLALPFLLGVAYPIRGAVMGEGVGAVRRGEFSTGTAIERVTEWVPGRKLAFVVVKDVPAMHELSPYRHVRAPHVEGYFRTGTTSFELFARPEGGTLVVERTAHQLRLDPVFYWQPLARWIVDGNNDRVLRHVKRQAEASNAVVVK